MLFGLSALFGRWVALPATVIVLGRAAFSCLTLALLTVVMKEKLQPKRTRDYLPLLGSGMMLAVHWTAFFRAVQTGSVAMATLTFATFPIMTALVEPILFREDFQARSLVAALGAFAGVMGVSWPSGAHQPSLMSVIWGLTSAASFAALSLINRARVRPVSKPRGGPISKCRRCLVSFAFSFSGPCRAYNDRYRAASSPWHLLHGARPYPLHPEYESPDSDDRWSGCLSGAGLRDCLCFCLSGRIFTVARSYQRSPHPWKRHTCDATKTRRSCVENGQNDLTTILFRPSLVKCEEGTYGTSTPRPGKRAAIRSCIASLTWSSRYSRVVSLTCPWAARVISADSSV